MTREEIKKAAEEYSAYIDGTDEERYNSTELEAFKAGAEWADNYPNWHSVEENPIKQDAYLVRVEVDVYGTTTPCKFTKYELAPYAEYQGVTKWHTLGFSYPNSRITHWMEIPAVEHPAKEQAVTIDAWVARNGNGTIHFWDYDDCPYRGFGSREWWESLFGASIELPQDALSSVTFENSPKKVKVTIEMEEEQ